MYGRRVMRALPLAATLLLAACAYGPQVRTDFDPAANFHQYRTYSWLEPAVPQGMNPLMFARVRSSIDRSLAARGFTPGNPGDFQVSFTIGERDRLQVYDYGPFYPGAGWGWGGWGCCWGGGWWGAPYSNVDIDQYVERSVIIDVYDAATKRPVWHGVATNRAYSDNVNYVKIDEAVNAALANFPPQPVAQQ